MRLTEREHGNRTYLLGEYDLDRTRASVAFTSRIGGSSREPFDSLNLGRFTADDPDAVSSNRRAVSADLSIDDRWLQAKQVHGARVVEMETYVEGPTRPKADAVVTKASGLPLAVMTADCVPIALIGPDFIGAVHAGWRGLCAGVVGEAARAVRPATAVIGPSIGPCHFEVGSEVPEAFRRSHPAAPEFTTRVKGKLHFNLWEAVRWQLWQEGVLVDSDTDPPCTVCDSRFYSYRRDGQTGRQALLVWKGFST